jgi:hypothetical protein
MVGNLGYDTSVFSGTTDGKLTVSTTNTAKVGTYKINVTQTATDNVSYTFNTSAWCGSNTCPASNQTLTKTSEFTITISNGCSDTTFVSAITLTTDPLAPNVGQTQTTTFTNIQTNAEVSAGVNDICGARTYRIINPSDTNAHPWITISGPTNRVYTITAAPTDLSLGGQSLSYRIEVTLTTFSSVTTTYTFNVNPVTGICSCAAIQWLAPSTSAPSVTVMVGSSYTFATSGFASLSLRYGEIVASSIGTSATDSRVR